MGFEPFLLHLLRDLSSTYLISTSSIHVHVRESGPGTVFACVRVRARARVSVFIRLRLFRVLDRRANAAAQSHGRMAVFRVKWQIV